MEKLSLNYHLKLQEMCDCYLETDFVPEMQHMATNPPSDDLDEDAIKYLALAIMHAITEQAAKLSLKKKGDAITVALKNDEKEKLPAPAAPVFAKIIEIVRTIINLAGNLQLKVIAEGVETYEQMDKLREIHVEEAQGFYFSKPLDSKTAGSMLLGMPIA